jgi:RNA polymerase sigma factor (sigma-70 family)
MLRRSRDSMATTEPTTSAGAWFPATHWSVVLAVGKSDVARAEAALEQLCRTYWYPLYAFARRAGYNPPDAEDLTQSFFAYLIKTKLVGKARETEGRFRSFLLASFKNFLRVEHARSHAQKRGGGQFHISLEAQKAEERFAGELATDINPESLFMKNWALTVVDHTLNLLETEFHQAGRQKLFERLLPFLQGDLGVLTYAETARGLGLQEGAIKMTVHRMRRRYRELLHSTVAHTVGNPLEVEEELRFLMDSLRG